MGFRTAQLAQAFLNQLPPLRLFHLRKPKNQTHHMCPSVQRYSLAWAFHVVWELGPAFAPASLLHNSGFGTRLPSRALPESAVRVPPKR